MEFKHHKEYAVKVDAVTKYFTEWAKKPINGNPVDRWISFLRWEKKRFYA